MKTSKVLLVVFVFAVVFSLALVTLQSAGNANQTNSSCQFSEMNYYFREDCSHCIRVLNDGSLEKLGELGVKVNKFEVIQWGMYGIYATPTFEFGGQIVKGYRTFDQLKELLGCERNI